MSGPRQITFADVVKRANSVCCLGDSITANNLVLTATNSDFDSDGYLTWANILLNQRLILLNNNTNGGGGVSGDTVAQMLARVYADVIAYNPGWAFVLGGVNSVNAGTSAASIKTDLESIYAACRSADINIVAMTFWENTNNAWTDAKRAVWLDVNQWIREYCRTHSGMFLVDACKIVTNPASMPAAGATSTHQTGYTDGVHPHPTFARKIGQEIANVIGNHVPPLTDLVSSMMDRYAYSSSIKQLLDNPMLQKTITNPAAVSAGTVGAGVTEVAGAVATGMPAGFSLTRGAGAGTATVQLEADANSIGNAARVICAFAAANDYFLFQYSPDLHGRCALGDTLYAECYIKITGTFANFRGPFLRLNALTSAGARPNNNAFCLANNTNAWEQTTWEGTLRTNKITLGADGVSVTAVDFMLYLYGGGVDTVTVDISRVGLYRNKGL